MIRILSSLYLNKKIIFRLEMEAACGVEITVYGYSRETLTVYTAG